MAEKKTEVAKTSSEVQLPAYVEEAEGTLEHARASDFIIPRLLLMQSLSPQVVDGDAKSGELYENVEGARFAELLDKDTSESLDFIPCYHYLEWFEWAERSSGKGIIARSTDPKGVLAQSVARGEMVQRDGRDLFKVTEYHNFVSLFPGYSLEKPVVISCSKTQIKKARALLTLIRYRGPKVPLYAGKYTVTGIKEHKADFTYWNFEFENAGFAEEVEYAASKALFKVCKEAYGRGALQSHVDEDDEPSRGNEKDF
ncbi:hypothetical protein LCGC14_0401770 [marine sediment metagenome]|uniref:Uncharacterized protein n=1 Tax=marine sediment metagenome TaxID=412755 RepID=A0A0F9T2C6_9ZZZZ